MYSIIVFLDKNGDCEGVPSSWIKTVGHDTFCFWPKSSTDISKMVRKAREPSPDWELFKCEIKSTADSYDDMKIKRSEALNVTTNCDSSDSEEVLSLSSSKRKLVTKSSVVNLSPPKKRAIGSVTEGLDQNPDTAEDKIEKIIQKGISDISSKLEFGLIEFHTHIIEIKEDVKIIRKLVRNNPAVGGIEKSLISESALPSLPLDSDENYSLMEILLKEDAQERQNLVSILSAIGGSSTRGIVNNCMNKIMTRELAIKFSLHGTKDKRAFKDSTLFKCVLETFNSHDGCKGSSNSDLMKLMGNNLAYAADRIQKKLKRQSEPGPSGINNPEI